MRPFGPSPSPSRTVPADLRVLLAVVRGIVRSPEDHGLDVALGQVSDWDALVDSALRHGLVAQLHAALESAPELTQAVVPGETRAGLSSLAGAIAVRSLRMTRQLLLLLERLHAAGIPALAVKGPALSRLAYGEPTLRRFVDLDILVRPSDVPAARAVVEAAGLVADGSMAGIPWATVQAVEQEMVLIHPTTRLMVELHWRIGPRFAPDSLLADGLFARAGAVELLGRASPTLSRADSVLALTVHASTHEWNRLEDVATLCSLLRTFRDSDWRALRVLASAHDCRRRLAVGLCLARDLGGLSIEGPYSCLAGSFGAGRLAQEAEAFLSGSRPGWWLQFLRIGFGLDDCATFQDERSGRLDRALGVLWQARALDSRRAGLRHLWRRFSTSGARDWTIAGDALPVWLPGPLAQLVRRQRRLWGR